LSESCLTVLFPFYPGSGKSKRLGKVELSWNRSARCILACHETTSGNFWLIQIEDNFRDFTVTSPKQKGVLAFAWVHSNDAQVEMNKTGDDVMPAEWSSPAVVDRLVMVDFDWFLHTYSYSAQKWESKLVHGFDPFETKSVNLLAACQRQSFQLYVAAVTCAGSTLSVFCRYVGDDAALGCRDLEDRDYGTINHVSWAKNTSAPVLLVAANAVVEVIWLSFGLCGSEWGRIAVKQGGLCPAAAWLDGLGLGWTYPRLFFAVGCNHGGSHGVSNA
jgi:hypothetical protein